MRSSEVRQLIVGLDDPIHIHFALHVFLSKSKVK